MLYCQGLSNTDKKGKCMKNILITGSTSGIGKATALWLEQEGYRTILVGRNENKLKAICDSHDSMEYIVYDFNDIYHVDNIFEELINKEIVLDGMVHCAGISPLMKVEDNDPKVMEETFRINYFSFLELMKYFQRQGTYNPGASVIAISSVVARCASYRQAVYGGSKAALEESVRCLSKELIQKNIRVNCIAPGAVETEMVKDLENQSEGLKEKFEKIYPLGMIPPVEVAKIVEILLTERSEYMTGGVIQMDAGFWAWK